MMRYFNYIIWLLIIFVGAFLTSLNAHSVMVHYYFGDINVFLPVLLLLILVLGIVLGGILVLPKLFRAKRAASRLKRKVKQTEQELKNLRTMPLRDEC